MSKLLSSADARPWVPAELGAVAPPPSTSWIREFEARPAASTGKALWEMNADQAYQLGLRKGAEKANKQMRLDYEASLQAVQGRLELAQEERFAALYQAFRRQLEGAEARVARQIVDLAVRLAEATLRNHIAHDPQAVVPVLREALAQILPGTRPLAIRIHPDDEAVVRRALIGQADESTVSVIADARVARSGCLIDSPHTEVDQTLETRWIQALMQAGLPDDIELKP